MKKAFCSLFILLIAFTWLTPTSAEQTISGCPIPNNITIVKPDNNEIPPKLGLLSGIWEGNWASSSVLFIVEKIDKNDAIVIYSRSGSSSYYRLRGPIKKGDDGNYRIAVPLIREVELIQTDDPNSIRVVGASFGPSIHPDFLDSMFRRKELPWFVQKRNTTATIQQRGAPAEAKKMVEDAIAYIKANGKEKAFAEISNPKGKFVNRDLYVYVSDMYGTCLARGDIPGLVGKNNINWKDPDGKFCIKELIEMTKTHESGWQDCRSRDPISLKMIPKTVYFEKVEDFIVCCGASKFEK